MKVKLNAKDRFIIKEEVLPIDNAPRMDILLTIEIVDIIDLRRDEFEEYGISMLSDGRFKFDGSKDGIQKEFELNKHQVDLIKRMAAVKEKRGWSRFNAKTLEKIEKW